MEDERAVTLEQGQELASSLNVSFMEASAKKSLNVDELFNKIATDIMANMQKDEKKDPPPAVDVTEKKKTEKKKGGCSLF